MVLDVMLPGIDGFAVAGKLRSARNFIPVLMLTARGRPEDVLKGFASGADDYLPKPFELPILLARSARTVAPSRMDDDGYGFGQYTRQDPERKRNRRHQRLRCFFIRWTNNRLREVRVASE